MITNDTPPVIGAAIHAMTNSITITIMATVVVVSNVVFVKFLFVSGILGAFPCPPHLFPLAHTLT